MDHFIGMSMSSNIASMIGQANKTKNLPTVTRASRRLPVTLKAKLKNRLAANNNIKRFHGMQKIPLNLKQQNDR